VGERPFAVGLFASPAISPCQRGRAISLYSLGIFAGAGMAYIFGGLVTSSPAIR
jgi:hypothetical protein